MTDRAAFLKAIKAQSAEDSPRLAYADWLDEHGAGDLDAATAEFIRLSCDGRAGGRKVMPRASYAWIGANWQRLVPSVVALHVHPVGVIAVPFVRSGRTINAHLRLNLPTPGCVRSYSVWFEFARGFCGPVCVSSPFSRDHIKAALAADQPLSLLILGQ